MTEVKSRVKANTSVQEPRGHICPQDVLGASQTPHGRRLKVSAGRVQRATRPLPRPTPAPAPATRGAVLWGPSAKIPGSDDRGAHGPTQAGNRDPSHSKASDFRKLPWGWGPDCHFNIVIKQSISRKARLATSLEKNQCHHISRIKGKSRMECSRDPEEALKRHKPGTVGHTYGPRYSGG